MRGKSRFGAVTIDRLLDENFVRKDARVLFRWVAPSHVTLQRAMQRVIFGADNIVAAIPPADRFARSVVERPALAGLHARLMDLGFEHVIVVAHHDPTERVDHFGLVADDVEHGARVVKLLGAARVLAVVGDAQKSAAETVEMGDGRGVGVRRRLPRRRELIRSERAANSALIPGRQIVRVRQKREEIADIGIALRIERDRVVDVVGRLHPRVENHLLERIVGMQRRDDALGGIVEQRRTNAPFFDRKLRRRAEEGLVLPDRLALVVVNFRARANPTRVLHRRVGIAQINRAGLGRRLGLRLAPEAVGIDEMHLHVGLLPRPERADMGLAGDGRGADGRAVEVIDDARRRRAEIGDRERARVGRVEKRRDLLRREIGDESVERIALDRPGRLALYGGSREHTQRVEHSLRAIAVGIGHQGRL